MALGDAFARDATPSSGWVTEFLAHYDALDATLVLAGFPPTSPWWRSRIARFLTSGRSRWVLRVGRRGGKSSTLSRLLCAWMLWGPWTIPPGDTAMIAIVSVDREEAAKRLVTIVAILEALGVTHEKKAQAYEIHVPERRAAFAVKTCSLTGTVGFTSIAIFCDEQAKWNTKEDGANPAAQVMATLRPTMLTQPLAFEIDCSAPWGTDDYHAKLCADGDTAAQIYDHGATWEANPSPEATKERTRELEPDETEWKRAYGAIPSASLSGDWFGLALDAALGLPRCDEPTAEWIRYTLALDVDFSRDHLSYAVTSSRKVPADPRNPERPLRLTRIHETKAWALNGLPPRDVAFRVVEAVCAKYPSLKKRPRAIVNEDGASFQESARQAGLAIEVIKTGGHTKQSEAERYRALRMAMSDKSVQMPDAPGLIGELRGVRARATATGNEVIELPRIKKLEGGKMGPVCRVPAVMLAVSESLLWGAQAEPVQKTPETEQERARAAAVKEIVDRRRREWQKSPEHSMRQRMARMH